MPAGVHARGRRPAGHQISHIRGMESVRVLIRCDGFEDTARIHLLGQGHLHQDSVDLRTAVEIGDQRQHFFGSNGFRGRNLFAEDVDFGAGLDLAAHVHFGSRIVTHQDHRQTRAALQLGDTRLQPPKNFVADGDTVQDLRHSKRV